MCCGWQGESPGLGWGWPRSRLCSHQVQPPDPLSIRVLRGHQQPITCLVISPDDKFIFSAAKDGSIIKCKWLCLSSGAVAGCQPAAAGPRVEVARLCPAWRRLPWGTGNSAKHRAAGFGARLLVSGLSC